MIDLQIQSTHATTKMSVTPTKLVIAGWTGRNKAKVDEHIRELQELGVAPPKTVPVFYRVDRQLLTCAPEVEMVGQNASGEAEVVLWKHQGDLFVGIGSDHTDRQLETVGITLSKQLCAKPISATVWPWGEVADHWDDLILRSFLPRTNETYQEGPVSALRRPNDLLALYEERHGRVEDGTVLFCGTLATIGNIRFSEEMAIELIDPVLGRRLRHSYAVSTLPIAEA
jgi:hypothetical protein